MKKTIKVLSIDGGGTRGLFPATMLKNLEVAAGKPVTEIFDVIVGAATGGIIAVAISAGMKMEDIMDIYLKKADYILPTNFWRKLWNPLNLFAPKYSSKNLKRLLEEKVGAEKTLNDVRMNFGTDTIFLFGTLDMSPDLEAGAIPAFKVVIYNSAMAVHQQEKLVDIAMRTSAAAVNLPLYERYSEGGSYANDPSMIGLSFCMNRQKAGQAGVSFLEDNNLGLGAGPDEIKFLSLGCGSDGKSFVPRDKIGKGNWGMLKWFGKLLSLVIETKMVADQYYMGQFLDQAHYLRLTSYYKAEDAPEILRDKKLNIDVRDTAQLQAIRDYAEQTFAREKDRIFSFLNL